MRGSLKIGRIAGIAIYIHWTFAILVAWLLFTGGPLASALEGILFLAALFSCVLLHELGHALTAKYFGVRTRDITLLPIGGVARLERIPEKPTQELWITINGPMVNVVIAGLLFALLAATGGLPPLPTTTAQAEVFVRSGGLLFELMLVNVTLVVFNLLPAFPMDGGRILRAILAYFMDYPTATTIAARVGQAMAVVFAIAGVFGNPFLFVIAIFVFFGAQSEASAARFRSAVAGLRAADAMMTSFRTLADTDTLQTASDALLAGAQQDFPVVATTGPRIGQVVGVLPRAALVHALSESGPSAPVAAAMRRDWPVANPRDRIVALFQRMQELGVETMPIIDSGRLVGLLTLENLGDLLALRQAVARSRRPSPPELAPGPAQSSNL